MTGVGQAAFATLLSEQNLTDRQRVLGPDHPSTLTSRNNLAWAGRSRYTSRPSPAENGCSG